MEKVSAVVVTYNRLGCLKKVIECLKKQTHSLNNIIVVNNDSNDGTTEWLAQQKDLIVFHQDNIGGSGGFYKGIKEAMNLENDWIWCMDDDVYPREDCLEKLLEEDKPNIGILCPKRIQNNTVYISEYKKLNLSNPFRKLHQSPLRIEDLQKNIPIEIEGMVFEGPLIKRTAIKQIGLPNKDLFIFYDDTDYSYRCVRAGYKVMYIPKAILDKELFFSRLSKIEIYHKNRWKTWYHIRNTAYFCKHYAKNSFYKLFGGIGLLIHMFFAVLINLLKNKKYEKKDLFYIIKMYYYGRIGKLGKI